MAIPNKSPLKIWEIMERGRIQGLSKFFWVPLLSQERVFCVCLFFSVAIEMFSMNKVD